MLSLGPVSNLSNFIRSCVAAEQQLLNLTPVFPIKLGSPKTPSVIVRRITRDGFTMPRKQQPNEIVNVRLPQDALRRLHEFHIAWVGGRAGGRRTMLRDCDLAGLDLSHMNFTDAVFVNCDFSSSEARGVKFTGAILRSAKFDRADLTGADFCRADLRGASFLDAQMIDAVLDRSDLRQDVGNGVESGSSFKGANLTRANFSESKMRNADFSGALLKATNLVAADLRGASFCHAEIEDAAVAGAHMSDTDFSGAIIGGSMGDRLDMLVMKGPAFRKLDDEEIEQMLADHAAWVKSQGVDGMRADFSCADLTDVDFSGRNLCLADFSGALLSGARLHAARLIAADFRTANLTRADLSEADLRGANFAGTHRRDADFTNARTGLIPGLALTTRGLSERGLAAE
jgi:uncharacterized protein YjbI with pentapeptide repeats